MTYGNTGQTLSAEARADISDTMTGKPKSAEHRVAMSNARRGIKSSPASIARRAATLKQVWADRTPEQRLEQMRPAIEASLRRKETGLEKLVAEALDELGQAYTKQVRIGKYFVDFLMDDTLVVEANGCYYHVCKQCGYKDYTRKRARDTRRRQYLERRGHTIIVVWEHDQHAAKEVLARALAV